MRLLTRAECTPEQIENIENTRARHIAENRGPSIPCNLCGQMFDYWHEIDCPDPRARVEFGPPGPHIGPPAS